MAQLQIHHLGNYITAIRTACNYIKNSSRTKYIVFLSFNFGVGGTHLDNAIKTAEQLSDSYDKFFTTACCDLLDMEEMMSQDKFNNNTLSKYGGYLKGSSIGQSFEKLSTTDQIILKDLPTITKKSQELKVELGNINTEHTIKIKINEKIYTLGENLAEYVVYFKDSTYWLDLEILAKLLDKKDFNDDNIEITYTIL